MKSSFSKWLYGRRTVSPSACLYRVSAKLVLYVTPGSRGKYLKFVSQSSDDPWALHCFWAKHCYCQWASFEIFLSGMVLVFKWNEPNPASFYNCLTFDNCSPKLHSTCKEPALTLHQYHHAQRFGVNTKELEASHARLWNMMFLWPAKTSLSKLSGLVLKHLLLQLTGPVNYNFIEIFRQMTLFYEVPEIPSDPPVSQPGLTANSQPNACCRSARPSRLAPAQSFWLYPKFPDLSKAHTGDATQNFRELMSHQVLCFQLAAPERGLEET